jgi:tetratricopeptide (TPR) repeat protein
MIATSFPQWLKPVIFQPVDYQVGGSLSATNPTYVTRTADDEFFNALLRGIFCWVLNSRQVGKSSLRIRTVNQLRSLNIHCAEVDLNTIGSSANQEQWYAGIACLVAQDLLTWDIEQTSQWWQSYPLLNCVQRLQNLLLEVLPNRLRQPIVICIDEIDSILSLPFSTDDFFALIRSCHENRAQFPEKNLPTFALLGVATPTELIQDETRTPFNIGGQFIELGAFSEVEAQPLVAGLVDLAANPQGVLQEVLRWTEGQPFLTQKLFQKLRERQQFIAAGQEHEWVERVVQEDILTNWEEQDQPQHLRTIQGRILVRKERAPRLLGLIKQVLQQEKAQPQGDLTDSWNRLTIETDAEMDLRLTGLVCRREGRWQIYNPIYHAIFTPDWVAAQQAQQHPHPAQFQAWEQWQNRREGPMPLLKGQALEDTRLWAADKLLSEEEHRFLINSVQAERTQIEQQLTQAKRRYKKLQQEMQIAQAEEQQAQEALQKTKQEAAQALQAEQDTKERLEQAREARQELELANQKAQQRIRWGSGVLAATVIAAGITGGGAWKFATQARQAQHKTATAEKQQKSAQEETKKIQEKLKATQQDLEQNQTQLNAVNLEKANALQQKEAAQLEANALTQKLNTTQSNLENLGKAEQQARTDLGTAQTARTQAEAQMQAAIRQEQEAKTALEQIKENLQTTQMELKKNEENLASFHPLSQALVAWGQDGPEEALEICNEILAQYPNNPLVLITRGAIYVEDLKDLDKGMVDLRQVIELDPDNSLAHLLLGIALKDSGDVAAAIASYRQAIALAPQYAAAYYNLGIALKDSGDLAAAIASFQQAIAIDPQDAVAYNNLGIALYESKQIDRSIDAWEEAARLNSTDLASRCFLAIAYYSQGNLDQAIRLGLEVFQANPALRDEMLAWLQDKGNTILLEDALRFLEDPRLQERLETSSTQEEISQQSRRITVVVAPSVQLQPRFSSKV